MQTPSKARPRSIFAVTFLTVFVFCTCIAIPATAQSNADNPPSEATPSTQSAPAENYSAAQAGNPSSAGQPSNYGSASSSAAAVSSASHGVITSSLPEAPLPEASRTTQFIDPNQPAPVLNVGDKLVLGLKCSFSPFAIAGWFTVAGYEQLTNGTPNFGTDRGAFGRRLEDASIRDASEDLLSDSVMSTIFREDPRYYRLGPTHPFINRFFYAATRPLITRTDSGATSPNYALLTGNLAGSVLTNAYYPQANRTASQTIETFAGSIGGSAFGDVMDEFFGNLIHHRHADQQ